MSPPLAESHDELRVENYRHDELPGLPDAVLTGADRDPETGRFVPGNAASRRRALKRMARELPWLDSSKCADWIRPYIDGAKTHAVDLLAELPAGGAMCSPMAEELATARLVYRGLLALGLAGDTKALAEARAWFREARQHALALEGLSREIANRSDPEGDELRRAQMEFQVRLLERQRQPTSAGVERSAPEPHSASSDSGALAEERPRVTDDGSELAAEVAP